MIPLQPAAQEHAQLLRKGEYNNLLMRKLGPFSVNVYPEHFSALQRMGAIEVLDPELGILIDFNEYSQDTGLSL